MNAETSAFDGTRREGDGRGHAEDANESVPPGFEGVAEMARRLEALESKALGLAQQDAHLSNQLAVLHATGVTADVPDLSALRRKVRDELEDVRDAIPLLRRQIAEERESAGRAAAEARMTGIARAHGALLSEYGEDGKLLVEAAQKYAEIAQRLNDRNGRLALLGREASALADRFGVATPKLPTVQAPGRLPAVTEALKVVSEVGFPDSSYRPSAVEQDERGLRTRRSYLEIQGSPSFSIIQAAGGPQPWPALTERQRELIAERDEAAQKERLTSQQFAAEADRSLQRTRM